MEKTLSITCEARLQNLPEIRGFIESACQESGADPSTGFALKLAVDEACTNIILYGYPDSQPGPIQLSFSADAQQIVVTIGDRANAFSPEQAPPPDLTSPWEERKTGGLGWYLILRMMDQVHYHSDAENGNVLTLIKKFPQGATVK